MIQRYLSRVFCNAYGSFGIGLFAGVVGMYMLHKMNEHKEMVRMQEEINAIMAKMGSLKENKEESKE